MLVVIFFFTHFSIKTVTAAIKRSQAAAPAQAASGGIDSFVVILAAPPPALPSNRSRPPLLHLILGPRWHGMVRRRPRSCPRTLRRVPSSATSGTSDPSSRCRNAIVSWGTSLPTPSFFFFFFFW